MQDLKWCIASEGLSTKNVTHVLITHYHIDHGDISQEMKDKDAKLIVMENQIEHLNEQKQFVKPPLIFHEVNYSPLTGRASHNYVLLMYSSIFALVTTPAVLTA